MPCLPILMLFLVLGLAVPAQAQQPAPSTSFADSLDRLASACGQDIDTHCAGVNLSSNRLKNCLSRNQASLTPVCRDTYGRVFSLIDKRVQVRNAVSKACEADTKKLCAGQTGAGATIDCLLSAKRVGWRCAQAMTEANFLRGPSGLAVDDIIETLRREAQPFEIDVKEIHERALERMKKPGKPQDRAPLVEGLDGLPQLTLDLHFNSDAAVVRPESYQMLARLADALHHPYLLDRKILVVAHTESAGRRQNNLDLSQKRAATLREILVTTFRVSPQRVAALGLGEEQLLDRARSSAPANRRVQIIVTGRR
jgi:outer membrane protein OmpA-like peptidoglycan-associated protein